MHVVARQRSSVCNVRDVRRPSLLRFWQFMKSSFRLSPFSLFLRGCGQRMTSFCSLPENYSLHRHIFVSRVRSTPPPRSPYIPPPMPQQSLFAPATRDIPQKAPWLGPTHTALGLVVAARKIQRKPAQTLAGLNFVLFWARPPRSIQCHISQPGQPGQHSISPDILM